MPTPNSSLDANKWGTMLNNTISSISQDMDSTNRSNIGPSAPTRPGLEKGQAWIDDSNPNSWKIQIYDGTSWVETGAIDSTNHTFISAGTSSLVMRVQTFVVSGTYTPSTGMDYCLIEIQAGGAGGSPSGSAMSGGGGGEYRVGLFTADEVGSSRSITVGTGGGIGVAGGTTVVTGLMHAEGGQIGYPAGAVYSGHTVVGRGGSRGGTGGTGGFRGVPGCAGSPGLWFYDRGLQIGIGGNGGDSFMGAGGAGSFYQGGMRHGDPGTVGGGGGGGAVNSHSGVGGDGIVVITEYCQR